MTVRAKFTVNAIKFTLSTKEDPSGAKDERGYTKRVPCELQTIEMSPVYGNGDPAHENTKFWQASPSGSLSLGCINAAAAAQFELGKDYYVDFTPSH